MAQGNKKNIFFNIFAILLIAIILFFSNKENQEKFIEFIDGGSLNLDRISIINSIQIDGNIDDAYYYDDYIIIRQDNKLIKYNSEGLKEWEKEFNFNDVYVTFEDESIYVYDRKLGDIYYLDTEGNTIGRFNIDGEIKRVKELFGYIAVHVKEGDKEGIEILDNKGKIIFSNFVEGKSILDYCFHDKADEYVISEINLKDGKIKSSIELYDFKNELLWDIQLEDEIIMYLNYVDEDGLIAMSDEKLYYIYEGNIAWQKDIPMIKDIYMDDEFIYVLYDKTYEILSLDGSVKKSISLSKEYNKFTIIKGYGILYSEKNITGFKGSKRVFEYEADGSINKVIEGKNNLIVVYENKVDIVTF